MAEKAAEIFNVGRDYERKKIFEYLNQCADQCDFKDASPNEVIKFLMDIMKEKT